MSRSRVRVASWNLRRLTADRDGLAAFLANYPFEWDILLLQELVLPEEGSKYLLLQRGHQIFLHVCHQGFAVAVVVHARHCEFTGARQDGNRWLGLELNLAPGLRLDVVCAHFRTGGGLQEFVSDLDSVMTWLDRPTAAGRIPIVGGDFNAAVGELRPGELVRDGSFFHGSRCLRGRSIVRMLGLRGLSLCGARFPSGGRETHVPDAGQPGGPRQLDYITAGERPNFSCCDYQIFTPAEAEVGRDSDHHLVMATFETIQYMYRDHRKAQTAPAPRPLDSEEFWKTFDKLRPSDAGDTLATYAADLLKSAGAVEQQPNSKRHNATVELKKLIRLRDSCADQNQRHAISKLILRFRKELGRIRTNRILEAAIQGGRGVRRTLQKEAAFNPGETLLDSRGVARGRSDWKSVLKEFWEGFFTSRMPEQDRNIDQIWKAQPNFRKVSGAEVQRAAERVSRNLGAAPGVDGLPPHLVRGISTAAAERLAALFTHKGRGNATPDDCEFALVSLLAKKRSPQDPGDFRPVSVLTLLTRLFDGILHERLRERVEPNLPRELHGFRQYFQAAEVICQATVAAERSVEWHKGLVIGRADVRKAFDSVEHAVARYALMALGADPADADVCLRMHCGTKMILQLAKIKTDPIMRGRGLLQGSVTAPLIFNTVVALALRPVAAEVRRLGLGLRFPAGRVALIAWADDLILFAETRVHFEQLLAILDASLASVHLEIAWGSAEKVQFMANQWAGHHEVRDPHGNAVSEAASMKILGAQVGFMSTGVHLVEARLQQAGKIFWARKRILLNRRICRYRRGRVLHSMVAGCLMWGLAGATLSEGSLDSIRKLQNQLIGRMLRLFRHPEEAWSDFHQRRRTAVACFRRACKLPFWDEQALLVKWGFAGHVARQSRERTIHLFLGFRDRLWQDTRAYLSILAGRGHHLGHDGSWRGFRPQWETSMVRFLKCHLKVEVVDWREIARDRETWRWLGRLHSLRHSASEDQC